MTMTERDKQFATSAVHAGQTFDPSTGAVMTPIYATSTYRQKSPGVHQGYEYSRTKNPTRFAYENCIAELEKGTAGFAFASGMAAAAAALELLPAGSHVVAMDDLYGGTYRLFEHYRARKIFEVSYVDMTQPQLLQQAIKENTQLIWVETPTNPLLKIVDLAAIVQSIGKRKIITLMDNTFATPYLQQPLAYGFDLVLHSATKYLNGHSDVIGGMLVTNKSSVAEQLAFIQNTAGGIAGPFDSYLAMRGVKTLAVRMERHCSNALELAHWLDEHSKVEQVIYPGLASHPQHELAKKQMKAFGGMLSFELTGGLRAAQSLLEGTQLITLAESLGGVESLIEHPASMTHAAIPQAIREKAGITQGLIRLSVGIEDVSDLKADLQQGLTN